METRYWVADAFTDVPFRGNPAAVVVLDAPRPERWMQDVAREMNLSETAFAERRGAEFLLRWFTPTVEVDLCGHATLATAHVLTSEGLHDPAVALRFHTRSGILTATRDGGWIQLDFPALAPGPEPVPPALAAALGARIGASGRNRVDWLVELASEAEVRALQPDFRALRAVDAQGVIVTARSSDRAFDFVSRYFAPNAGIDEDPVTGAAHCALGPWWSARSGRADLTGRQVSARGGTVRVGVRGDRVLLGGQAVTVARGALLQA